MALSPSNANPYANEVVPLSLPGIGVGTQTVDNLKTTHKTYQDNINEWLMLYAAYDGVRALVDQGVIKKHERESQDNYDRRVEELYSFGYTKAVVDLLTFYLFKREVTRDLDALTDYDDWQSFTDDCDLEGQSFSEFLTEQARYASNYGHIGVLVDKANYQGDVRADELREGIYPYVAAFHPPSILDWKYERDRSGRPHLSYLKLKDDDDQYRLWWRDHWEVWREPDDSPSEVDAKKRGEAILIGEGPNPLGEIPFVWLYNLKKKRGVGFSDVHDIARIDISIIRNLSQGEEVINYGAFPMLLAPMLGDDEVAQDDTVGITAVREFNPENPEGTKPSWLEAKVQEPITALLAWIDRKIGEIYRAANAGGTGATEDSSQAMSGVALTIKHQLLNSKLAQKAVNLEKAEKSIVWLWLKWQAMESVYDNIRIERPRSYDVQNLGEDLENILTSLSICHSDLFQRSMEKQVARRMLPSATEEQLGDIDDEIDQRENYEIEPTEGVELVWEKDQKINRANRKKNGTPSQPRVPPFSSPISPSADRFRQQQMPEPKGRGSNITDGET